jgi:hypothetical protein
MQSATQGIQQPQNLGTILTVSGILVLLVPFIGGAIGGDRGRRPAATDRSTKRDKGTGGSSSPRCPFVSVKSERGDS